MRLVSQSTLSHTYTARARAIVLGFSNAHVCIDYSRVRVHFVIKFCALCCVWCAAYGIAMAVQVAVPAQNQQRALPSSIMNWRHHRMQWKRNFNCFAFSNLFIFAHQVDCSTAHTHTRVRTAAQCTHNKRHRMAYAIINGTF